KGEADLIEEVCRIYGYENITETIPRIVPNPEKKPVSLKIRGKTAEILVSAGLNEIITYSMVGRGVLNKVFSDAADTIAVRNPLSAEQEVMRPSLVPGALNALSRNINRRIKNLKVFELGSVYNRNSGGGYIEKTNVCIALTGFLRDDWQRAKDKVTFFDLKGMVETLFFELGIKEFTLAGKQDIILSEGVSSEILHGGRCVGKMGCLAVNIQDAFDLNQEVYLAEIYLDALFPFVKLGKKFRDIPKYPSVKRDISLILEDDIPFGKIVSLVEERGGELVENIEPFDSYTGKQIPPGHKGLSFRVEYRDREKTLTTEDVEKVHAAIRESLSAKLAARLR
ncbi:MAG: hypothetical protein U9R52_02830, partial [Candidatus Omnitrophota bacterium]|nr:hypothetical protein [Candidatus Omnitrophota bacterium]